MPRRIDLGRALLALGGAVLFISLFLRWYDTGPTGWEVFEALDLVLAALALGAIAVAVRPELTPAWAALAVPAAALIIVGVQLVNAPPAAGDGRPAAGAWLALGGSALIALGAALALAQISVTVAVGERELRRRVEAVDRRGDAAADRPHAGRFGPRATPASASASAAAPADPRDRTEPFTALGDEEPSERS